MKYDVDVAADELMLTAEELKEVFECYFDDAVELMASCYTANREADYTLMAKKVHALKGASMSLRMHDIAAMVIELESLAHKEEGEKISRYLPEIENALDILKKEIDAFYNNTTDGD